MKKKLKISYNSPVVLTFVLICLAVLILGFITLGKSTSLLFMTYHSSLLDPLTYVRFFTHVFGHNGWEHLLNNAAFLLLLFQIRLNLYSRLLMFLKLILPANSKNLMTVYSVLIISRLFHEYAKV